MRAKLVNETVQNINDQQLIKKDDPARWDDEVPMNNPGSEMEDLEDSIEEADEEGAKMVMTQMRSDQIR